MKLEKLFREDIKKQVEKIIPKSDTLLEIESNNNSKKITKKQLEVLKKSLVKIVEKIEATEKQFDKTNNLELEKNLKILISQTEKTLNNEIELFEKCAESNKKKYSLILNNSGNWLDEKYKFEKVNNDFYRFILPEMITINNAEKGCYRSEYIKKITLKLIKNSILYDAFIIKSINEPVIIFTHFINDNQSLKHTFDADNIDSKSVTDILQDFFFNDDNIRELTTIHTSVLANDSYTEVEILSKGQVKNSRFFTF